MKTTHPKFMLSRTTIWLRLVYVVTQFPGTVFTLAFVAFTSFLPQDEDVEALGVVPCLILSIVVIGASIIWHLQYRRKHGEPHYFAVKEIISIDFNARQYKDDIGLPCVRVRISYDSLNSWSLKEEAHICEFRIFTYLDFENRFKDAKQKILEIMNSIPCYWGEVPIGGGDDCSCWIIPKKFRTKWGLVEQVTYFMGCEM